MHKQLSPHGDYDHMGEAINLVNNFKVEKVIFNCGDFNELKEDLEKLENAYYNLTGKQMVKYFRPPEGEFTKEALKNVQGLGYKTIFWSVAHYDWNVNKQPSTEKTINSIMDNFIDKIIFNLQH